MNGKVYVGQRAASFKSYEPTPPVTGVVLKADEENVFTAGDLTGNVWTHDEPYATQEMADSILAALSGRSYRGFEASAAQVVPEAELGDGVTVSGLYSGLDSIKTTFGPGHMSEISAPGEFEPEEEYKFVDPNVRATNYKFAQTRSLISKTAEDIRLEVSKEIEGLTTSFDVALEGITGQVNGLDGKVTTAQQTADKINWLVKSGESETDFTLTDRMAQLTAESIDLSGYVTFNSLKEGGTTEIDGSRITTGTINADRINLTGSITWDDLTDAVHNTIYAQSTSLPSYIKSTYIDHAQIVSPTIKANVFDILPDKEGEGSFNIYGDFSGESGVHVFTMEYYKMDNVLPTIQIYSPASGEVILGHPLVGIVELRGRVRFSNDATVTGLRIA